MAVLDPILVCSAGAWSIPPLVLLAEVVAAGMPPSATAVAQGQRARCAVVVPAHDEAHGIAATLATVRPQLAPGDRLLVVADNCTDATADVARAGSAEVVERTEPERRGKGHAMAAGVRALAQDPPEVVVFVDADCALEPQALDRIVRRAAVTGRPVQADYRMDVPAQAVHGVRLMQFAWLLRNHTRAIGLHRLAGASQLHGSGMAIPWAALQRVDLDTDDLVEDLRLGLELACEGLAPMPCPEAVVTSTFAASARGRSRQRRRWEQGHVATLLRCGPRLLVLGFVRGDMRLIGMALDVMVPPLALLCAVLGVHLVLSAWLAATAGGTLALALVLGATLVLTGAVALAWLRTGRTIVPARAFLLVPVHVLCRLPVHLGMMFSRPGWQRAERP